MSHRLATVASSSTLTVSGTSTLHDWQLTARRMTGHAALPASPAPGTRLTDVEVRVAIEDLEASGGLPMMIKLRDVLKSKHFSSIAVIIEATEPFNEVGDSLRASGAATLHVAGARHQVTLDAQLMPHAEDTLRLKGEHRLSLRALGLKPPTAFFGQLKTGDAVTVVFSIDFTPS
ncbi:MAG: hypothetical protein AAF730_18135 [Bacteroidota bacterium]